MIQLLTHFFRLFPRSLCFSLVLFLFCLVSSPKWDAGPNVNCKGHKHTMCLLMLLYSWTLVLLYTWTRHTVRDTENERGDSSFSWTGQTSASTDNSWLKWQEKINNRQTRETILVDNENAAPLSSRSPASLHHFITPSVHYAPLPHCMVLEEEQRKASLIQPMYTYVKPEVYTYLALMWNETRDKRQEWPMAHSAIRAESQLYLATCLHLSVCTV